MIEDLIGYDEIIENSMRSVIFETLKKVEKDGLPGNHYFIITFATTAPNVDIPKVLSDKYVDEMTVAIQYQFRKLKVAQDKFEISLSFDGKYETLVVPYQAITSFSDPSMNFALKFSVNYSDLDDIGPSVSEANSDNTKKKSKSNVDLSAKVVSLDAFRKDKENNNNNDK